MTWPVRVALTCPHDRRAGVRGLGSERAARDHDRHDLAYAGVPVRALPLLSGTGRSAAYSGMSDDTRSRRPATPRGGRDQREQGYSRSSGPERAHFYEYALGSAREARGWYYKCCIALPVDVAGARIALLSRVIRILTAIIPRERVMGTQWRTKRNQRDPTPPLDALQQPVPAHSKQRG